MTDFIQRITVTDEHGNPVRITKVWKDNGDGTYSEQIYASGVTISGDVSISIYG